MSISTRDELIAAVKRWKQDDTLVDEAYDDFIILAEDVMNPARQAGAADWEIVALAGPLGDLGK